MTSKENTGFRLARYVAVLALEPDLLKAFLKAPRDEMAALGLSEHEQELMTTVAAGKLFQHLYDQHPEIKPLPGDQPGDDR